MLEQARAVAVAGEHIGVAGETRLRGDHVERQLGQLERAGVALLARRGRASLYAVRPDVGPAQSAHFVEPLPRQQQDLDQGAEAIGLIGGEPYGTDLGVAQLVLALAALFRDARAMRSNGLT